MAENEVKEKNGKKRVMAFLLLGALAVGTVGGAYAFFTARSAVAQNTFTIAEGDNDPTKAPGTIDEPGWNPDDPEHENLMPNQIVVKDPKYTHTANWDGIVYLEVTVPVTTDADVTDNKKQVQNATLPVGIPQVLINRADVNTNLFNKLTDQTKGNIGTLISGDNWQYVGVKKDVAGKLTYVYGYNQILAKGQSTSELFTKFQVLNYTKYNNDGNATKLSVDIQAKVVQSEGFETDVATLSQYNAVFVDATATPPVTAATDPEILDVTISDGSITTGSVSGGTGEVTEDDPTIYAGTVSDCLVTHC